MFVVFDIGTSRLKVSAFSEAGDLLGQIAVRHSQCSEGNSVWQSADEWWRNACSGFADLMTKYDLEPEYIRGFSVSGRAGAGVFVDSKGTVIEDPWSDNRHRPQLLEMKKEHPGAPIYALTLLSKYRWLIENKPKLCHDIRHALYAKDFLLFRLAGVAITDPSSGPDSLAWLSQEHVDERILPRAAYPWTVAGELTAQTAAALGCRAGIPVAVGAHDGICANTGCAMLGEGEYALTLGTHAVSRTITTVDHGQNHRFYCYPPDRHAYGGNSWHIGSTMNWMLTSLAGLPPELDEKQLEHFNSRVTRTERDPSLVFLPYMGGQTIPERREPASGSFHGMSLNTNRDQMVRAILQGSAFAIYRTWNEITSITGPAKQVNLTGGGIVFAPWLQLIANLLQQELVITDSGVEGRGAAVFCAVALGDYKDIYEAASAMQPASNIMTPEPLDQLTIDQLGAFSALSAQV